MSLLTGLFNLLALLYIGRAVQLAIQIGRNWNELRQEPLTGPKQRLAEQAAFFLGVPPAVLIHELCHALAVILFGGRVAEFGYRVFWGYVVPQGSFSAVQNWIIAVAGTLGSLGFGAALWLLLRRNPSRTIHYFGLRAFRFQVYFSLLYYPIFTLFLPIGDWRVIYNFQATPIISGVTALVHALALLLFWRADRSGWFEMAAFGSTAEQFRYEQMAQAAVADPAARLHTIAMVRNGGAPRQAGRLLDEFLKTHPESAEGHLQLALLSLEANRGQPSRDVFTATEKAIALGLRDPDQAILARQLAAMYHLQRGDGAAAEAQLSAALAQTTAFAAGRIEPLRLAQLHRLLSQAHRRQGQFNEASAEIETAIRIAEEVGLDAVVQEFQGEREVIRKHAGRPLANSADI